MPTTRRRLLRGGALAGLAGVAGCLGTLAGAGNGDGGADGGGDGDVTTTAGTTDEERPDGVYVQPYVERMAMAGTATAGDYGFGVMWTTPHVFWTPTNRELSRQPSSGSLHLMATVWDAETRLALPEAGVNVEVARDGDLVSQEVIYPMLSQRMGFHYGGNFTLDGDGTYTVRVSVGGTSVRRTGAFADRFGDPATAEVALAFTPETKAQVSTRDLDAGGQPGAVEQMQTEMLPDSTVPTLDALPGQAVGTGTSDDAALSALFLPPDAAARYADDGYLAVLAATPYNRSVLPSMGLTATLTRGDTTLAEGSLTRTLDPDLGYHYGLPVAAEELRSGDRLTLSVTTPPQVSRHEGYETAFLEMDDVTLTV